MQFKLSYLPVFLIWFVFVYAGLRGVDFGYHWDEWQHVTNLNFDISQHSFLTTRYYNYPSVIHWLSLIGIAPLFIRQFITGHIVIIEEPLVIVRAWFLLVSSLSIPILFLTVRRLTGTYWQAIITAALLGLSWEFSYHARWIAADAILLTGVTLILLATISALQTKKDKNRWFLSAFIMTGICAGTKYPAVLTGIIPWLALVTTDSSIRKKILDTFRFGGITILTFLITTPGIIVDNTRFIKGMTYLNNVYSTGHYEYAIEAGWIHLRAMIEYLLLVTFSPYTTVSLLLSAMAVIGWIQLLKHRKRETLILSSFPILLLALFSLQSVMIVRNILLLLPFLCIAVSFGITHVFQNSIGLLRLSLIVVTVCTITLNGQWLLTKSQPQPEISTDQIQILLAQIPANSGVYVSEMSQQTLDLYNLSFERQTTSLNSADVALFNLAEIENPLANNRATYIAWTSGYEINLNYYPTWDQNDRLVLVNLNALRSESTRLKFPRPTL